ncbi:MAG: class I SAM-dependent methyltransferase [Gammaproteobacteria bacterium]|nr:MAG: class I SAM-dependent methyltransferase [Gammaproteobacteria bacterium]
MLTYDEAKRFYDSFGEKQDRQFYEEVVINDLIEHSELDKAKYIVEFGCGTGKLASRLLNSVLPPGSKYVCIDVSETMVALCQKNIERFSDRARCYKNEGSPIITVPDQSADRFISTYVLDLLNESDVNTLLNEAYRILKPSGILCLASLTHGTILSSRIVEFIWNSLYRINPRIVGGCRPINLVAHVQGKNWDIVHNTTLVSYGVPSEVLVARRL